MILPHGQSSVRKALLWLAYAMLSQATALFWELHWRSVHEGVPCGWAIRAAKRWCTSGIATHLFFLQPSAVDSRERSQENKRHRASICAKYNLYQVSVGITLADASWQTSESIWSIWEGARMRTMWDAKGPMGQCHTAFFFPLTGSTLLLPPTFPPEVPSEQKMTGGRSPSQKEKDTFSHFSPEFTFLLITFEASIQEAPRRCSHPQSVSAFLLNSSNRS